MSADATVFVIDDDESVLKALARLIGSVELKVETFSSAQAFLAKAPSDRPSCLVVDVRMPGLSGLELQQELNRTGVQIPIIFISGHGNVPMSVKAMKAGAIDFLQKPFNDQELLDAIHQAIASDEATLCERDERVEIQRCIDSLTPREHEVLTLVITGLLNKQIASELNISEKTVKVHRARVMRKMQAQSLPELVHMAHKVGIPDPS